MGFLQAAGPDGFSLVVEVDPPKGTNLQPFLDQILGIKGRVEGVAVTDGASAIMRMTPLAPCRLLIEKNVEPLMILNGRDRNRIAFQGDLLAAGALGVQQVLLKRGQDPAIGDQPMAADSGDLDLTTMLDCTRYLREGRDLGGDHLDGKLEMTIGVQVEVSDDVNLNRQRAGQLADLAQRGASFVVLGPTYDANIVELFASAASDAGLGLFPSVMLLKSVAMIRYLNNMPGVPSVPHEFLKAMIDAPVKQQAGLQIAADYIRDIRDRCQGVVLIALGWGDRLGELLDLLDR